MIRSYSIVETCSQLLCQTGLWVSHGVQVRKIKNKFFCFGFHGWSELIAWFFESCSRTFPLGFPMLTKNGSLLEGGVSPFHNLHELNELFNRISMEVKIHV